MEGGGGGIGILCRGTINSLGNYFKGNTYVLVCSIATVDPVRLVSPTGSISGLTAGRLEIFINNEWGTVCDDFFGLDEANTACLQLRLSSVAVSYGNTLNSGLVFGT